MTETTTQAGCLDCGAPTGFSTLYCYDHDPQVVAEREDERTLAGYLPSIDYPTGRHNFSRIFLPGAGFAIFYSYSTPVSFSYRGRDWVRENDWGPTTGKHLNWIDGGDRSAKRDRVDGPTFNRALATALRETFEHRD